MNKLNVGVVSLGCDKNRIDSEIILSKLSSDYQIVNNPKEAHIILVNTCGFIEASKQESIDTILEMAKYKENYNCKVLIVSGCLTQRYKQELQELLPEADIILGVNDYDNLNKYIKEFLETENKMCICNSETQTVNEGNRILTTDKNTAYVRIAEGCNNYCSYCIIPKIRGNFRSRQMENIIKEVETLASNGVKEIILVAQDCTRYGTDLYKKKKLHELLNELSKIKGITWIRLLYCYPEEITDELINEIAINDKICKYIDMPIQHISNNILKNMRRKTTTQEVNDMIDKVRARIPGVCIRTSIIVGFPGETEEDFEELKEFLTEKKIDKLGVFKYSQEEGTPAAEMENQIAEEVKEKRLEDIMLIQQSISKNLNAHKIGNYYKVIIEGKNKDYYFGRNYEMAPEIDGAIFVKCDKILNIGDFVDVKITDSLEYDLMGVV